MSDTLIDFPGGFNRPRVYFMPVKTNRLRPTKTSRGNGGGYEWLALLEVNGDPAEVDLSLANATTPKKAAQIMTGRLHSAIYAFRAPFKKRGEPLPVFRFDFDEHEGRLWVWRLDDQPAAGASQSHAAAGSEA